MYELVAINSCSLWSPYVTALLRKLLFAKFVIVLTVYLKYKNRRIECCTNIKFVATV